MNNLPYRQIHGDTPNKFYSGGKVNDRLYREIRSPVILTVTWVMTRAINQAIRKAVSK